MIHESFPLSVKTNGCTMNRAVLDKLSEEELSASSAEEEESVLSSEEERDEVKEIRKASQKETRLVHCGRVSVGFALLLTAVAVTITTYLFLQDEQQLNFEVAVSSNLCIAIYSCAFLGPHLSPGCTVRTVCWYCRRRRR